MLSFRLKIGVWLALTALTLQPALSFGHVHFFGVCNSHCGTAVTGTIAKVSKIPAQEPADSNNGYCAVCASIQLADNSLPQAPYRLSSSFVDQTIEHAGYVAVLVSTSRRTLFQSRAPPPLYLSC
jgi:hypothetical protein